MSKTDFHVEIQLIHSGKCWVNRVVVDQQPEFTEGVWYFKNGLNTLMIPEKCLLFWWLTEDSKSDGDSFVKEPSSSASYMSNSPKSQTGTRRQPSSRSSSGSRSSSSSGDGVEDVIAGAALGLGAGMMFGD